MTSPPQRQLGADGPAVSAVGLGCMSISWGYYLDPQEEAVSERTLQRAVELGVTHFDTASLYGRGHNETLVGRALRDRPRGVLIASNSFRQITEIYIFAGVLVLQSLPFLAAVAIAILELSRINSFQFWRDSAIRTAELIGLRPVALPTPAGTVQPVPSEVRREVK